MHTHGKLCDIIRLSTELLQRIAVLLDQVRDALSFAKANRRLYQATYEWFYKVDSRSITPRGLYR